MICLEGQVNGYQVFEQCTSVDTALFIVASLLDRIDGRRLLLILSTLYQAVIDGRWWGWVGEDFALRLSGQRA